MAHSLPTPKRIMESRPNDLSVSIVIPCAEDDGLAACLDSIDIPSQIICVLNQPHPAIEALARERATQVVVIELRNLGAAFEAGCRAASGDLIVIMTSDARFRPGGLAMMKSLWRHRAIVASPVEFPGSSYVIERLQRYQEAGRSWCPGLLFHRDIVSDLGGVYFNPLHWTEDADFDRRRLAAEIEVIEAPPVVWHSQISIRRKLHSAYRYGGGRRNAEGLGFTGTSPEQRVDIRTGAAELLCIYRKLGRSTALYSLIWMTSYRLGYWAEGLRHDLLSKK